MNLIILLFVNKTISCEYWMDGSIEHSKHMLRLIDKNSLPIIWTYMHVQSTDCNVHDPW